MSHHTGTEFSIADWYGRKFPTNYHEELEEYCESLCAIPEEYPIKHDFATHLPVQTLLSSPFPSHTHFILEATSDCFSENLPDEVPASLIEREIPPWKFIQDAKSLFGQAVLDRRRSIKDPLGGKLFLPFWIITVWEQLADLNAAKGEWLSAVEWFQRLSKCLGSTSMATKEHLARIGWCAEMKIGSLRTSTSVLTQLLADTHLNDTILDLMANHTQAELNRDGPVYVCGSIFMNTAVSLARNCERPKEWFRARFICPIEEGQWSRLYCPMFWEEYKHWVSIRVNFRTGSISIGWRSDFS